MALSVSAEVRSHTTRYSSWQASSITRYKTHRDEPAACESAQITIPGPRHVPMEDFLSIEGPVERVGADLVLRIPLFEGGYELVTAAGVRK